jgi:hypothetical protein
MITIYSGLDSRGSTFHDTSGAPSRIDVLRSAAYLKNLRTGCALIALFAIAQLGFASPNEIVPPPSPTTPIATQSRTALKHRTPPTIYIPTRLTVPDIIALNQQLPAGLSNTHLRESNSPLSPIEGKIYAVEGDLWRVKMEANDCDYHLELAARGGSRTADRIIVEIPEGNGYDAARKQLLSLLPGAYVFKPDVTKDLAQSIPIRVTGYAFCDAHHWSAQTVRGNGHGTKYTATLWELHPVWKIEAIGP